MAVSSFIGKPAALCLALLAIQSLIMLHHTAAADSLTLFWYVDDDDILVGKTPDKKIPDGDNYYGTQDPPVGPTEKKEAEDAVDNIRGSTNPPASNMNKIPWDPTLEATAVDLARRCDGGAGSSLKTAGEIVVASTARLTFKDALAMVAAERVNYDHATNTCKKPNYLPCDHYKLLVSATVSAFACARAHCPDTALPYRVHCVLSPKPTGTAASEPPNKTGTPCQLCPRERGYCYNNLCVSHEEKNSIMTKDPNARITCDAPCLNCGKRTDQGNTCFCQCPAGYDTAIDCSVASSTADPNSLTCGPCERQGQPCLNGGLDSGEATCRCLCPAEFRGPRCQVPRQAFHGGVMLPTQGPKICAGTTCAHQPPDLKKADVAIKEIKDAVSIEINKFCRTNQENYIKCCGFGTLPTSGSMDFVNPSDIHAVKPFNFNAEGKLISPIYATVKGNNPLCRKTTADPTPIVPVPSEVLKEVINGKVPDLKASCCDISATNVKDTVKDWIGGGLPLDIACIVVSVS